MKYPKLWDGASPVGEALVRALQRTGAPWLRASTADGVIAGKMARLSEVKQGVDQGWVSAGDMSRYDLTGLQLNNRSWRLDGGTDQTLLRKGVNERSALLVKVPQSNMVPETEVEYLGGGRTHCLRFNGEFYPDGTEATGIMDLSSAIIPGAKGRVEFEVFARDDPDFTAGAFANNLWHWGVCHNLYSEVQEISGAFYSAWRSDKTTHEQILPPLSTETINPRQRRPMISRVSPNELLGFTGGFTSPSSLDPYGSQIVYSNDNGFTWFYTLDGTVILTDRTGYDAENPYVWQDNEQVFEVADRFFAAPVEDSALLIVVGGGAYGDALGVSIRVYRWFGDNISLAGTFSLGGAQHMQIYRRGGHHQGWPFMQTAVEATNTAHLVFVHPTGGSIHIIMMPAPAHWVGFARALDEDTLQCVIYRIKDDDFAAGYYIHISKDFGETWTPYRRVELDETEPSVIFISSFQWNFSLLAYRKAILPKVDGRPTYTYPGAPWIGDDRVTPPWELET